MDDNAVNLPGQDMNSKTTVSSASPNEGQTQIFCVELQTLVNTANGSEIHFVKLSNVISFACVCLYCGEDVPVQSLLESYKKTHANCQGIIRQTESGSALFCDRSKMIECMTNNDGNGGFQDKVAMKDDPIIDDDRAIDDHSSVDNPIIDDHTIIDESNDVSGDRDSDVNKHEDKLPLDSENGSLGVLSPPTNRIDAFRSSPPEKCDIQKKREPFSPAKKKSRKRKRDAQRPSKRGVILGGSFMEGHCSGKPYGCSMCDKRYRRGCELAGHVKTHTRDVPICHFCNKPCKTLSELKGHILVHTGEKQHPCPVCGKMFRLKAQVTAHLITHTNDKRFTCTDCGAVFSRKNALMQHSYSHKGRSYVCTKCGKTFKRSTSLRKHVLVEHEEKHYTCDICGKVLRHLSTYREHCRRHGHDKPYQCVLCEKGFIRKCDLTSHMRTHTGNKPYSCSECGKMFNQKCYYEEHLRIHTGEKPYQCTQCDLAFRMRAAFRKHQLEKHTKTNTDEEITAVICDDHPENSRPPDVQLMGVGLTGEPKEEDVTVYN